jgi:flagellar M-ring protein FliF
LQDRLTAFINFLRQLGPIKLAIASVTLLAFLLLFSLYLFKISSSDMSVLYSGLDQSDSSRVASELDAKNIPYVIEDEGSIVRIPGDEVLKTRLHMAAKGLPNHGSIIGYEIFDKEETLGTTNFLQNVKLVRALEGELTRTISSFDAVTKARIHLVIPQREVFAKDRQDPRASVILKLIGKGLSKSEINSITHLMVTAVPGLDIRNITIVDTAGRSLKLGGEDENTFDPTGATSALEEYRINYESRLARTIEELLERSLGNGKVRARVSADINFDRIVTNSETYDPDSAVVRSVQSVEERERTPIAGEDSIDVSILNNLPGSGGAEILSNQAATVERSDETKNYEISKTVRSEISESGAVRKLSVAVLVDGTYKEDKETGDNQYTPRSEAELKQIENLVKATIGYSAVRKDKVEVVNMAFMDDMNLMNIEDHWLKEQLPSLFQSLVLAIIVILVFLTIVRPMAMKIFDVSKNAMDKSKVSLDQDDEEAEQEIEVSLVERKVQTASIRKVTDVMNSHPDEALTVLRRWLNENG